MHMKIQLWPEDFEKKEFISAEERFLMRSARKNEKEGHFVIGIDPINMSRMGLWISPKNGLITFTINKGNVCDAPTSYLIKFIDLVEDKIYERLLDSKLLIVRKDNQKFLKFPYKHVVIFPNQSPLSRAEATNISSEYASYAYLGFFQSIRGFKFGSRHTAKGDIHSVPAVFGDVRKPFDLSFSSISEKESKAIFERLAPEYTVVIHEKEECAIEEIGSPIDIAGEKITGKEVEFKTFFLDKRQVSLVNELGKGHRVLLANAGAGKSVILLSKALKYASMFKESRILLTCFNNNLSDSYAFKRRNAAANSKYRNLHIMTLHRLVRKLYDECLGIKLSNNIATEDEIRKCIEYVKNGTIQLRFKAVFIDEVQIFDPIYLELCYALYDKSENGTFLMAGDLNQSVRKQSRKGDVPWKKIENGKLDFSGRVKYIEENYRNSKEISKYLLQMLQRMNRKFEELNIINTQEYLYDTYKEGTNSGIAIEVIPDVNRMEITRSVISAIRHINTKYNIGYSEMAVLFPFKDYSSLKYHFMKWLTDALDKEGIIYSTITNAESGTKTRYSDTEGIVLSTIDSSLGLDFKAVIVTGLFPYNYVYSKEGDARHLKKLTDWKMIARLPEDEKETVQIQIRKMYTACSRARDLLCIISDINKNSPMDDILIGDIIS